MPDIENMVLAVGILFLSCLQAEMYVYDGLTAAILIFLLPVESGSRPTQNSTSITPDLENMVLAVGITCLSCLQAEIYSFIYWWRFSGAILNFSLPVASFSTHNSTSSTPDLENVLLPVGI